MKRKRKVEKSREYILYIPYICNEKGWNNYNLGGLMFGGVNKTKSFVLRPGNYPLEPYSFKWKETGLSLSQVHTYTQVPLFLFEYT